MSHVIVTNVTHATVTDTQTYNLVKYHKNY